MWVQEIPLAEEGTSSKEGRKLSEAISAAGKSVSRRAFPTPATPSALRKVLRENAFQESPRTFDQRFISAARSNLPQTEILTTSWQQLHAEYPPAAVPCLYFQCANMRWPIDNAPPDQKAPS